MGKHSWLVIIGFILWISETWYFGWNMEAQSTVESMLDTISFVLIVWGVIGDTLSGLHVTKNIKKADIYMNGQVHIGAKNIEILK